MRTRYTSSGGSVAKPGSGARRRSQEARGRDQWDRASIALSALAELRPGEPEVFRQLVQVTRRTRDGTAAAIAELERLAEAAPRSPWPLLELANLYDEQGAPAKAEAARQRLQGIGDR